VSNYYYKAVLLALCLGHRLFVLQSLERTVAHAQRIELAATKAISCERSVGTVFQLPNPDVIYSRDKEKERKVGRHPIMFVFAHGPRAAEASGQKEATRPAA
jgi:hypothetical protein